MARLSWEVKFIVRNIETDSFESSKQIAREYLQSEGVNIDDLPNLQAYAAREANGRYTVELR